MKKNKLSILFVFLLITGFLIPIYFHHQLYMNEKESRADGNSIKLKKSNNLSINNKNDLINKEKNSTKFLDKELNKNIEKDTNNLSVREAYAIIIGISNYPGTSSDLSYCDDDAQDVYSLMVNDYNFKPDNIIYLQNSAATKKAISNALDSLSSVMTENDILFFYYSGHGGFGTEVGPFSVNIETPHYYPNHYDRTWTISHPGAAYMRVHFYRISSEYYYDYLLCGDSDVYYDICYEYYTGNYGYNFWSSYIPVDRYYLRFVSDYSIVDWGFRVDKYEAIMDDGTHYMCSYDSIPDSPNNYYIDNLLDSKLDNINCSEKYVVVDACHSGGLIPEVQDVGRYIMTACEDDESSLESPSLQHGVFTNYFLESSDQASDSNMDGAISIEEMFSYTRSNTISYSEGLGYTHHPVQNDGIDGENILHQTFSSVNFNPGIDSLNYSFQLHGTGQINDLKVGICYNDSSLSSNIIDLTLTPTSDTGFGQYFGSIQLNESLDLDGFGIYTKITGNSVIILNHTESADIDHDSIDNIFELMMGTDPNDDDSDDDGLLDGAEINIYDTDPNDDDSDDDGLLDGAEINVHDTDPNDDDSDDDGLLDGFEISWGLDPLNPRSCFNTIILNIIGGISLIVLPVSFGTKVYLNNKNKKRFRSKKNSRIKSTAETYNALKIQKSQKPTLSKSKYKFFTQTGYSSRSSGYYNYRDIRIIKDEIKKIFDKLPEPYPIDSERGKQASRVANIAFQYLNNGKVEEAVNSMISSLVLGVPEPFNSQIKDFLLKMLSINVRNPNFKAKLPEIYKECPKCHTLNRKDDLFCINCGKKIGNAKKVRRDGIYKKSVKFCERCNAKNNIKNKICSKCGGRFKE